MTTTWNPADSAASLVLTNGNLTVTSGAGGFNGIRATQFQSSGKFYYEVTIVVNTGGGSNGQWAVGLANSSATLTSTVLGSQTANGFGYFPWSGLFFINGAAGSIQLDQTNGHVIQIATDLGAKLAWIKTQASNWNNSGTANPGTGVGGTSFSSMTGSLTPIFSGAAPGSATANFGDTSFFGTLPSGFTGWSTAGPSLSTSGMFFGAD